MRARRASARCWPATNACSGGPSKRPSCPAWRAPSRRQAISALSRRCGRTAAGSTDFTSRASHCLDPIDFDQQMKANPANNDTLEEPRMTLPRRRLLTATAATALAAPWIGGTARAQAKQLKISHQFPGGTAESGDFRDQMCRRFAAELAKRLTALMAEKGAVPVIWLWQAGGSASRTHPILVPDDVKGLKVRGGSREMDLMLKGAGAAVVSMPSNR